jgi:rubredoxin
MSSTPPPPLPPYDPKSFGPPPVLNYSAPGLEVRCPRCGASHAEPVKFTWWGGLLGPRMLHHVKCLNCRYAYNGKTGQSNTTGIVIYTVVGAIIGIAIVVLLKML